MKKSIYLPIFLIVLATSAPLAEYYCGFSGSFCGQSTSDDTNSNASAIILAFANIASNGSIILDTANYPCALVNKWQSQGKKVLISIGGANAEWDPVFANPQIAIASIQQILSQTTLNGVDLDIQDYSSSPASVIYFINALKSAIRGAFLTVAPQNIGVYQGQPLPNINQTTGSYWNYWVPILQQAGSSIDMVNLQVYNNWYDGLTEGSLSYIQDVYLQWRNLPSSFCSGCAPFANFTGVSPSKLLIGFPASSIAGTSPVTPSTFQSFLTWMSANNYTVAGYFLWDSYQDATAQYQSSNMILNEGPVTPITPSTPKTPLICPNASSPGSKTKKLPFEKLK